MTTITTSTGLRIRLYVDGMGKTLVHASDPGVLRVYRLGQLRDYPRGLTFLPVALPRIALGPEVLRAIATLIDEVTE